MTATTILKYIEDDDEYMYFEVFNLEDGEYVSKGAIYIGKVVTIPRSGGSADKVIK